MSDIEQRYVELLRGEDNSPLLTDGYKFPMAQAGFPGRWERFYLHFRKGGALFLPFDFAAVTHLLRPRLPNLREQGFLTAHGYGFTPAMDAALQGDLHVYAQPQGTWANAHEPVVAPSGPSFLTSWLEALVIAFQFPMQIATAIIDGETSFQATCEDESEIIYLVEEAVDRLGKHPGTSVDVTVVKNLFRRSIRGHVADLRQALGGEIDRAFEVGTRAMTCLQQHRIVLEELKAAGISRTANTLLAYDLYMIPVGTTGHEHQMRFQSDYDAFRAIRDRRPEPPSYLFDTYDPVRVGIPAAIETMLEDRTRRCSVRFDSGDQYAQLHQFVRAEKEYGIDPLYLFMDGYTAQRVERMEVSCAALNVPASKCHYGLGSYFVSDPSPNPYRRDRAAMVYKLSETGGPGSQFAGRGRPVMKWSGSEGKKSCPGRPIVTFMPDGSRFIAQEGEGFGSGPFLRSQPMAPSLTSPETARLAQMCQKRDIRPCTP